MNPSFWQGKRVLITGHTGFKGSWLSLWLQHLQAQVVGYALEPPSQPNMFTVAHVAENMTSIIGDVRDLAKLQAVFAEYQVEIVLHMAAQALVRRSYQYPIETYTTNVIGTANLLEAVRHDKNTRVAVCITSDKCYANNEWVWGYRENDAVGGFDPYSSSKGCAELVIAAYRNSFFQANDRHPPAAVVSSARAGNVIGGGDWAEDRLIPDIIQALLAGRPARIRNPNAIRPWQHVLEPLNGYLMLAEQLWQRGQELAQPWNFGPSTDKARDVGWIASYLTERWGDQATWTTDSLVDQPHEDTYLKLDCTKARSRLGWAPRLGLEETLDWIVDWYRAYQQERDMREVSLQQISRFAEREMP